MNIDQTLEKAAEQIRENNLEGAKELLEKLIDSIENDEEQKQYLDDAESEYHYFYNFLEKFLYDELYKPEKEVKLMPEDFGKIYFMYGSLLMELKDFDRAPLALAKAVSINPVNAYSTLEYSEIYKLKKNWPEYLSLVKRALKQAYDKDIIARCYRNLGYYYGEKKQWEIAIALYFLSMSFDPDSEIANGELFLIGKASGLSIELPSFEDVELLIKENEIQFGPSNEVLSFSYNIAEFLVGEKQYEDAKHYYEILYGLTGEDVIRKKIESLPSEIGRKN